MWVPRLIPEKGIHIRRLRNVLDSITILTELGFVINAEKSILTSRHTIVLLGFAISSENMGLTLTDEKPKLKSYHQAFFIPQMKVCGSWQASLIPLLSVSLL